MVLTARSDPNDTPTTPAKAAGRRGGGAPVSRELLPPNRGVRGWRTASVQAAASTDSRSKAERQLHKFTSRQPAGRDDAWMVRGACAEVVTSPATDVFFDLGTPSGGRTVATSAAARERTRQAKRICATCPVIGECLAYALATSEPFGVWGGLTEGERQAALRATSTRRQTAGVGS